MCSYFSIICHIFAEPYYLYDGCEKGRACGNGKSCLGINKCPNGCSFAECLQRIKLENADGFAFRAMDLPDPMCRICTNNQLTYLEPNDHTGVYRKKGKLINFPLTN